MFAFICGAAVSGCGLGGLWCMMPRNGEVHPWALKPMFDSLIPITIVAAIALGGALMFSAFT
jgi:hypothetical protein